jgi:hypothetical protein
MVESCGCKWDDRGNPVDLCDKHCPPFSEGLPTDEYLAVVAAGKGQLSDEYYE